MLYTELQNYNQMVFTFIKRSDFLINIFKNIPKICDALNYNGEYRINGTAQQAL